MTYDKAGNILSKNEYIYTIGTPEEPVATMAPAYSTGDWKDLMTGLDGRTISYDVIGNPLAYYNGMSFTWEDGRKLTKVVIDENRTVELEYNADGLLHKKTFVDTQNVTEETTYFYSSGVLQGLRETLYYEGNAEEYYDIWFLYDETGEIIGFKYIGKTYYYSKNLQGDVLAILDESGAVVGTYTYDAWGRVIKVTDGNGNEFTNEDAGVLVIRNPIRYRGYYYDTDLDLYYLKSRYYDPYSGRFLNADGYVSTGQGILGNNMFAYCNNNPVVREDSSGTRCEISANIVVNPNWKSEVTYLTPKPCGSSSVPHVSTEMDICTDGPLDKEKNLGEHPYGDQSHVETTARYNGVLPDEVNYMVIPRDISNYDSLMGCVGVVINLETDEYVYALVCEGGPGISEGGYGRSAWDEVSIRVAWELNGYPYGSSIANERQYGLFSYIIFTDSKRDWVVSDNLQNEIDAVGRMYWR